MKDSTQAMSFDDFCKRIHASPRKGRDIISRREIAVTRIGRRVLITEEAFAQYLAKHTEPAFDAEAAARDILGGK
jgi:excisionase family DNA binding protein